MPQTVSEHRNHVSSEQVKSEVCDALEQVIDGLAINPHDPHIMEKSLEEIGCDTRELIHALMIEIEENDVCDVPEAIERTIKPDTTLRTLFSAIEQLANQRNT